MKEYVDAVASRAPGLIYREGYRDWCAPNQGTRESFFSNVAAVNTAVFFQFVKTEANSASILNDGPALRKYRALVDSIILAYNGPGDGPGDDVRCLKMALSDESHFPRHHPSHHSSSPGTFILQ